MIYASPRQTESPEPPQHQNGMRNKDVRTLFFTPCKTCVGAVFVIKSRMAFQCLISSEHRAGIFFNCTSHAAEAYKVEDQITLKDPNYVCDEEKADYKATKQGAKYWNIKQSLQSSGHWRAQGWLWHPRKKTTRYLSCENMSIRPKTCLVWRTFGCISSGREMTSKRNGY